MKHPPMLEWALNRGYTYCSEIRTRRVYVVHEKIRWTYWFGEFGSQREFWNYFNRMEDWI